MLLHTTTNYNDERYNFLKLVEGYRQYAYADTKGIASIGIGINLRVQSHQDLVLQTFGFDTTGIALTGAAATAEASYIQQIRDVLNNNGGNYSTTTAIQNALAAIMSARAQNANYPPSFTRRASFAFADESESRTIFNTVMAGYPGFTGYESQLDQWLTANNITGISQSQERVALVSLTFNNKNSLLGPKLAAALRNDDRAEAWYEIRFNSNADGVNANRRYRESSLFSLYNDAASLEAGSRSAAHDDDAKAAYRMYTRHAETPIRAGGATFYGIIAYQSSFPPPPGYPDIQASLSPAAAYLVYHYGQGNTDIAWNHIQVGETAGPGHPAGTDADTLTGTSSNDLLFGESGLDTLKGGAGDDVLYGGSDSDFLYGDGGSDVLLGGEGDDTYYYDGGADVIEDADGQGRILYRDPAGTLICVNGGEKTPEDDDYQSRNMKPVYILLVALVFVPAVVFAREDCGVLNERGKEACVVANYEEADRELNRAYQAFTAASEEPESLRKAQRAWVQFRDAECSYVGSWETLTKNGPYLNRYKCLEAITLYRVKTLVNLRTMYESRPQEFVAGH